MHLNHMGSIQKRIKIPIFSKKIIFLAIAVLLLLTKTLKLKNEKKRFVYPTITGVKLTESVQNSLILLLHSLKTIFG